MVRAFLLWFLKYPVVSTMIKNAFYCDIFIDYFVLLQYNRDKNLFH